VLKKDLICEMQKQKYVSLLLDAWSEKASAEDLIFYVRYITRNKIEEFSGSHGGKYEIYESSGM
jgi:hypothetical protein